MARRQRIDSATGAVATMAAAARDLSPPAHIALRPGDMPFWDCVISEKPKSEWTESDLLVAANLARAMADAEMLSTMSVGQRGNVKGKIKQAFVIKSISAVDKLARRIVTLRRALGLDNRAKNGEQRDVTKRRGIAQEIEAAHNPIAADGDDLLARPSILQ
ncbi:terminase small subunit [Sphingomonas montanisoli]|uniref:Terminase small subunit n=1 Tax=Sphingomonas montanisoli TaxID=2606412 RepID=A0A5D9BZP2_9SPHN|nr:terminase small subunit [Sphingomonas montanisoli]TZG24876.1 terminase small subunit [Sphingomonas montanisoli]